MPSRNATNSYRLRLALCIAALAISLVLFPLLALAPALLPVRWPSWLGNALFFQDPIYQSVPERSRHALVSTYDHDTTIAEWALGFRFDMVLRGPKPTPFEEGDDR